MSDKKFIGGLLVKAPSEKAPEYVKARLSIKREELIAWLQTEQGEWINADIKESQGGKWYAQVDDWKSNQQRDSSPRRKAPIPQQSAPPMDDLGDFNDPIPF